MQGVRGEPGPTVTKAPTVHDGPVHMLCHKHTFAHSRVQQSSHTSMFLRAYCPGLYGAASAQGNHGAFLSELDERLHNSHSTLAAVQKRSRAVVQGCLQDQRSQQAAGQESQQQPSTPALGVQQYPQGYPWKQEQHHQHGPAQQWYLDASPPHTHQQQGMHSFSHAHHQQQQQSGSAACYPTAGDQGFTFATGEGEMTTAQMRHAVNASLDNQLDFLEAAWHAGQRTRGSPCAAVSAVSACAHAWTPQCEAEPSRDLIPVYDYWSSALPVRRMVWAHEAVMSNS